MIFQREPAVILGAAQTLIALAVTFGLELSAEQTGAILAALAAVFAVITRSQVFAPATVAATVPTYRGKHARPTQGPVV